MKFILLFSALMTLSAWADVTPAHVESMLQQMVKEKVLSPEQAERAKERLHNISPEQWAQIKQTAQNAAARLPAQNGPSSNSIKEVHGIDLDGEQFKQIQNDLRKIVPQSQD